MNAVPTAIDSASPLTGFDTLDAATSVEVQRLLIGAISSVDRDEAAVIALVRRASRLIRARGEGESTPAHRQMGGLAPWQVSRLRAFVDDNIAGTVLLDDMARIVKLSTSYFSTAFKASFGLSPHNYVIARRVEHAKRRMLASDAPLCEIALDCGLADQAHLSRVFRRVTGTTPSAWRRCRAAADRA